MKTDTKVVTTLKITLSKEEVNKALIAYALTVEGIQLKAQEINSAGSAYIMYSQGFDEEDTYTGVVYFQNQINN